MNGGSYSKLSRSSKAVHPIAARVSLPLIDRSKPELTASGDAFSACGSVTVHLRPQWVWHRLNDPCNWPFFFDHLSSVTRSEADIDEYLWSVSNVTCPMRLTMREPPMHLAWQSVAGTQMQFSGEIILEPLEWQTRLTVRMHYVTDDSRLSQSLQTLESQLQRDVTRMAQMLERPL